MRMGRITRSPLFFWTAVAVLAWFTGMTTARLVDKARADAARYGTEVTVVVAARDLDIGTVVGEDDVVARVVPAGLAPRKRVVTVAAATGRTVVVPVFDGSPVLTANLAPEGLQGIAALLPAGTRAVAVPTGEATAPLRRGDHVDVLVSFDPAEAGGGEPTFPVATGALVVDVAAEAATVAVGPEQAKAVAFAVGRGTVTLAVTGADGISESPPPPEPGPRFPPPPGTGRTAGTTSTAPPEEPPTPPVSP